MCRAQSTCPGARALPVLPAAWLQPAPMQNIRTCWLKGRKSNSAKPIVGHTRPARRCLTADCNNVDGRDRRHFSHLQIPDCLELDGRERNSCGDELSARVQHTAQRQERQPAGLPPIIFVSLCLIEHRAICLCAFASCSPAALSLPPADSCQAPDYAATP